eukprot:Plantae.Rhodophyta-Purpureofilum_apyrenoidigerum.ctg14700.p1 GENE.Plantae.Rhodophyta-Purpureofilum_apyrenoidigerum.ctg14700~~Plantae.Rhodophyta-Purpureofilum_apyrenoidigerum.ctg14700.p1  ORF type:complete len:256 (-),score=39.60 Plantae.Rhodophyta-Purpureofilum_apyrenoidigerum.ctg14700:611-1378(-)
MKQDAINVRINGSSQSVGRTREKIGVVIPVLNEERSIRNTIRHVRENATEPDIDLDVTVVDGGSTDSTEQIVHSERTRFLKSAPGRAAQMNAGAVQTSATILVFLHADTLLPKGYDRHIRHVLADKDVALGAFQLQIDSSLFGISFVQFFANLRSKFFNMPYGDQAYFLRKPVFEKLGGFPNIELMEDFQFARMAGKAGKVKICEATVRTSGRRWEKLGVLRTTILNQIIVVAFLLGVPPSTLRTWYRGKPQKTQ